MLRRRLKNKGDDMQVRRASGSKRRRNADVYPALHHLLQYADECEMLTLQTRLGFAAVVVFRMPDNAAALRALFGWVVGCHDVLAGPMWTRDGKKGQQLFKPNLIADILLRTPRNSEVVPMLM